MDIGSEAPLKSEVVSLALTSDSTMRALKAARSLALKSWCIGAGAVRNLVWDHLHGFELETPPEDIDLVFYDASKLSPDFERLLEEKLALVEPGFTWEVVNQATVHQWLTQHSGREVKPIQSLTEGVASWPEVATCVGLTLTASGEIEVVAPHGLADLFEMVVRWNPERVPQEVYLDRIARKRFSERWPKVKILGC
jgi:hypothetical protein